MHSTFSPIKLFSDILGEKSYFPPGVIKHENCLFTQFHSPQTELMKQLQGPDKSRSIRVVFATVAIGIGVNIHNIRHVIHITVPRTIECYYQEIGCARRGGKPTKASLYYSGHNISLNKPGMTSAMCGFCSQDDKCLGQLFGVGRSKCCKITHEVCQAIVNGLLTRFIKIVTGERLEESKAKFLHKKWSLSMCGCC